MIILTVVYFHWYITTATIRWDIIHTSQLLDQDYITDDKLGKSEMFLSCVSEFYLNAYILLLDMH